MVTEDSHDILIFVIIVLFLQKAALCSRKPWPRVLKGWLVVPALPLPHCAASDRSRFGVGNKHLPKSFQLRHGLSLCLPGRCAGHCCGLTQSLILAPACDSQAWAWGKAYLMSEARGPEEAVCWPPCQFWIPGPHPPAHPFFALLPSQPPLLCINPPSIWPRGPSVAPLPTTPFLKCSALLRDARVPSLPPFWRLTSQEFLWKQSLEILLSLGSPSPYPAQLPSPGLQQVCVCQCLAQEIYNLWQEGGTAFGSISSVLKQRFVARALGGGEKQRKPRSPPPSLPAGSRFSLPCLQHLSPSGWPCSHSLACFFSMWRLCRLLFLPCFPLQSHPSDPPNVFRNCPCFPLPITSPQVSLSRLTSPPVLDINNIGNLDNLARVAFLTANLITSLPLLKNPFRAPCCLQSQVLLT